jgi:hypothetical protein
MMKYVMPFVAGCSLTMAYYFIVVGDFVGVALALSNTVIATVYSLIEWSRHD